MASNLDLVNDGDGYLYVYDSAEVYHLKVINISATLGYVRTPVLDVLRTLPNWEVNDTDRTVVLTGGNNAEERSGVVEQSLLAMRETERFAILKKWRNERFPVFGPNKEVLFSIERCASSLFGIVTYGVHALAYVLPEVEGEEIKIWVSRRARTKQTYGGMLDSTAAGGMSSGEMPLETLVKECSEEASLPPDLVRKNATAVGMVTNFFVSGKSPGGVIERLQPECHYIYDLLLPPGVICKQNDDEVEGFYLWTVDKIKHALANREFKPNCALVMLDFFIRHGILTGENEMDYIEIVSRLHRRHEFPTR